LNKYSDNLKVSCVRTADLEPDPEAITLPVDMRQSDKVMFVAIVHDWASTDKLNLEVLEAKEGDLDEQSLLVVNGITPNLIVGFGAYAFDIKAENLSLGEFVLVKCRATKTGVDVGSKLVTLIVVANSDHLHFDKMGVYNEVFDSLHLTPAPPVIPI